MNTPVVIHKQEIISIAERIDTVAAMEDAFIAYSEGKAVVPPVAELLFDHPKGETHIKYGYIKGGTYFIVKVASGFYGNNALGISSSQGMMLLSSQKTGETKGVLLDDGHLTNIRTAAAGAVVAKYFAPKKIKATGIIGTGIQSRLQLLYLQENTPCRDVWVWGRTQESAQKYKEELGDRFRVKIASDPSEVAKKCNLIITTTPAESPLFEANDIQPGTHITAVGADTPEKQELHSEVLQKAAIVIADSIPQSESRGEVYRAVKDGTIAPGKAVELGIAIQNPKLQRENDHQITIADLTGVAVQDILIARSVYENYLKTNKSRAH